VTETWARDLQQVLVTAGRHVVRQVEHDARRPIDAFCVVVDSGSCWFAWDEAPVGWESGDRLPGRDGRGPGDFTVPNAPLPEALRDALVDVSDTYAARYDAAEVDGRSEHAEEQLDAGVAAAAAAALDELRDDLARLETTPGFVAHVIRFDGQWVEESVRRNLDDRSVTNRFPGIGVAHRRDVELGELANTRGARALVSRVVDAYAVPVDEHIDVDLVAAIDRELRGNGPAAVEAVLDTLELHARQPQFTDPRSSECQHLGMWTRAQRLTAHLLLILPRLWGVRTPQVEERLVELGRWLHEHPETCEEPERDVLGLNESLVARALHVLWPSRYPAVDMSHATNAVHNAAAYGFTASDPTP
jgi:hypothetical protein